MNLTSIAQRVGKELQRHAPTILTTLGALGVAATAYLTAKATVEATKKVQLRKEVEETVTARDIVQMNWRLYLPAATIAMATVSCIISANTISNRRQAALVSAYALSERAISAYKNAVIEHLGEEKNEELHELAATDVAAQAPVEKVNDALVPKGRSLTLDTFSGQYFMSDYDTIKNAMEKVNERCIDKGYASQNYFYSLIGARQTEIGDILGWNEERMMDLKISTILSEDNRAAIAISYKRQPTMEYHRVW